MTARSAALSLTGHVDVCERSFGFISVQRYSHTRWQ
jgi:hypothetical protein